MFLAFRQNTTFRARCRLTAFDSLDERVRHLVPRFPATQPTACPVRHVGSFTVFCLLKREKNVLDHHSHQPPSPGNRGAVCLTQAGDRVVGPGGGGVVFVSRDPRTSTQDRVNLVSTHRWAPGKRNGGHRGIS